MLCLCSSYILHLSEFFVLFFFRGCCTSDDNLPSSLSQGSLFWGTTLTTPFFRESFGDSCTATFLTQEAHLASPQPTPAPRGPQRSRGATAARPQSGRACGRSTCEDGPFSERPGGGRGPPTKRAAASVRPAPGANASSFVRRKMRTCIPTSRTDTPTPPHPPPRHPAHRRQ